MDIIINANQDPLFINNERLLTSQDDWWLNFFSCLGYAPDIAPLGDLLSKYHRLDGKWLVMNPMHWQATHNDATIVAYNRSLQLTTEESLSLFNAVANFLKAEAIALYYHDSNTWLINIDTLPTIVSIPTHAMLNQPLLPVLKAMDKSWPRLITELQMLLHSMPTNLRPDRLAVNGVWIYGEGSVIFPADKVIMTNDDHLQAAFPHFIKTLSFDVSINPNTILLINADMDYDKEALNRLNTYHHVRWFWHNSAYITPKMNVWRRFWMKLC